MKKAGGRDGEEEAKAFFLRGRPLSLQYSAQISQFSLLPEESTPRKHSGDFSGISFSAPEAPGSQVQEITLGDSG